VVETARALFESAGYRVESGILAADAMGWPQTRQRFFMVAHRNEQPIPLRIVAEMLAEERPRSLMWAIEDLQDTTSPHLLDQPADLSDHNRSRIDWLFDNNGYELPPPERPPSHRNRTIYRSVYGRMRGEHPAPTLTTGFLSPGRGRYVHPTRRRTLTLREAARIQGFPDTYRFVANPANPPPRTKIAQWIGNAVPMPLGYAAALSLLAVDQSS
jgi:DNA (cytosine-5)-methyltransferase 1